MTHDIDRRGGSSAYALPDLAAPSGPDVSALPRWPLSVAFVGFPVFWALGFVDVLWIPIGLIMGLYLAQARGVRVPRGFGLFLVFLVWSAFSVVTLSGGAGALMGFGYRWLIYAGCAAILVYVYNAAPSSACGSSAAA